ncbi:ferredoxin [Patescibacteria group bacterium]
MRKPVIGPRANCISDGNCWSVASKVFRQGADGKAEVIELSDYEAEADKIDQAISGCPSQIIKWQE